jgi:hypothetical protein
LARRKRKSPPLSRVEQTRQLREQQRLRSEAVSSGQVTSLSQAAALKAVEPSRLPRWRFHVPAWSAALAVSGGWYAFGETQRSGIRWLHLAGSLLISLLLTHLAVGARTAVSSRTAVRTALAGALLVAMMAVGGASSVVVDGKVQATTSDTARLAREIDLLTARLTEIAAYDDLLKAEPAMARGNLERYQSGALRMEEIAAEMAELATGEMTAEELRPVARDIKAGAEFGGRALMGYRDLVVRYDDRLEAEVRQWHEIYYVSVLTAGRDLSEAAQLYGLPLVNPDRDPVE